MSFQAHSIPRIMSRTGSRAPNYVVFGSPFGAPFRDHYGHHQKSDMIWYDMSLVGHEFQSTYNVDDSLRTADAMDDTGWHYADVLFPVFLLLVATFKMAMAAATGTGSIWETTMAILTWQLAGAVLEKQLWLSWTWQLAGAAFEKHLWPAWTWRLAGAVFEKQLWPY